MATSLPTKRTARKMDRKISRGGRSSGSSDRKVTGDPKRRIFKSESKRTRSV